MVDVIGVLIGAAFGDTIPAVNSVAVQTAGQNVLRALDSPQQFPTEAAGSGRLRQFDRLKGYGEPRRPAVHWGKAGFGLRSVGLAKEGDPALQS